MQGWGWHIPFYSTLLCCYSSSSCDQIADQKQLREKKYCFLSYRSRDTVSDGEEDMAGGSTTVTEGIPQISVTQKAQNKQDERMVKLSDLEAFPR